MRKSYGNTWWGKQWLNALNDIDYSNRLPRGKTYANKGLVKDILIEKNYISAKVQGSRYTPYDVEFTIPAFSANEKATIIEIVTSNPLYLSKMLNRKLPTELMEACQKKGVYIFPNSWQDISGDCSCPDWAVPCKHMASVLYLVANEIDKNPFFVFQLHDFDLFKGLEGIGYTAQGQQDIQITSIKDLWQPFSFKAPNATWDKLIYQQLDFSSLPDCRDNLLAILGESPVFYPFGNFKNILSKVYTNINKVIRKTPYSEEQEVIDWMDTAEEVEILLDKELDFLDATFRDKKGKAFLSFSKAESFFEALEKIPFSKIEQFSLALKSLYLNWTFAKKLAEKNAFIPQLLKVGTKHSKIRWIPATLNPAIKAQYEKIHSLNRGKILFYKTGKEVYEPNEEDAFNALLAFFLGHLVHENHGLNTKTQENKIIQLFFNGTTEWFNDFDSQEYPLAVQLWLNNFYITKKTFVPVLQVDDFEGEFQISIAAEDSTKPLSAPIPLKDLLLKSKFNKVRLEVLRDLAMLSEYFPQINQLVASKGEEELFFDADAFVEVLFKILPTIRLFGIKVLLPKALRKLFRPQVSMVLESEDNGAISKASIVNMDNLLNFHWQIALGDQLVHPTAFSKMVKQFSGIVKLNDQYVFFDENEIKSLIEKIENPPNLNGNQLLQVALTEEYEGAKVILDENTQKRIDLLLKGEKIKKPKGLKATLRPYQKRGFEWMYRNSKLGFGSLIADDMGLGKTLQIITTLLKLKEEGMLGEQKALAIVPTTLLTNWEKEIKKFAPSLSTHIYHGPSRKMEPLAAADILITTYGVARSETAKLQKQKWLVLVIDEAQNIKNPGTAQTKAVKKIKAPIKIAMSGTPVENRLSEYWSIFDFTNKGYLSTLKKFKDDFARPIEVDRDLHKLDHFRKITSPFILRRLKSDKSIIKDLPEKIQQDQYCTLTPEQTAIYQNVVETTMQRIEQTDGINRKGLVLKLITALKQICNHPRHFLKKGKSDADLSGKMTMLLSLLPQILAQNEKTLIFTQYQEMGKILVELLGEAFDLDIPFLHGGVSRKKRDEMVEAFQNNRATRIMILSLKAAGTGLNLTAANNVIHYDLWWNPAVEAQATDRAYRIGQNKNVLVHRFITKGTFEEKINQMLESKKELADLAVSTGEKWIGDFSNEELKDLVALV